MVAVKQTVNQISNRGHHGREDAAEGLKDAIQVDQTQLRGHIDEVVRSSVEETLNVLLEAEAHQICGAERYQRSPDQMDTRAGH